MAEPESRFRPWSRDWYEYHVQRLGVAACHQLGIYEIPQGLLLTVVIPIFNEEATLERLVSSVARIPISKEIILIDDGSTDGTPEVIEALVEALKDDSENEVRVQRLEKNSGKGSAVKAGFLMARGDIVLIQDADQEYDPREYPRLIQPIVDGKADVVFGSRFLGDQPHRVLYYWHYLGNKCLTLLSNCCTNLNLTDMETCYKVFSKSALDQFASKLTQKRFGIEPEITARVAHLKLRVYEIAISYSGRTYAEGKKIGWRDGIWAIYCILRYRLFR